MPSLLIRDMSESTKRRLAVQAAEHGRSQQAEALAILEKFLNAGASTWLDSLRKAAEEAGGIDIPTVERHSPRITGTLL